MRRKKLESDRAVMHALLFGATVTDSGNDEFKMVNGQLMFWSGSRDRWESVHDGSDIVWDLPAYVEKP